MPGETLTPRELLEKIESEAGLPASAYTPEPAAAEGKAEEPADDGFLSGCVVAAVMAASLPPRIIEFRIQGADRDSRIVLRKMDGDGLATYRDILTRFSQSVDGRGTERVVYEGNLAEAELALLIGTVREMTLYSVNEAGSLQLTALPADLRLREDMFRRMEPDFRTRLVNECKRENGLHPKSKGSAEPSSGAPR